MLLSGSVVLLSGGVVLLRGGVVLLCGVCGQVGGWQFGAAVLTSKHTSMGMVDKLAGSLWYIAVSGTLKNSPPVTCNPTRLKRIRWWYGPIL